MATEQPPARAATSETEPQWGRVLLCGGTDWAKLGRKGSKKAQDESQGPDLLEPHILRSLGNVKAVSVHTSHSACHCVVIDVDGAAWLFGRNERAVLGAPALGEVISESSPLKVTPQSLNGAAEHTKFVHAACGRSHTLLVGSEGQVWSCGANNMGQCGHSVSNEVTKFKLIDGPTHAGNQEKVITAAAGLNFSLVLTESGKVFAFGSAEKGQLGNGVTGEHIVTGGKLVYDAEPEPLLVRGALDGKRIVQIACGQQHSVALDSEGVVYVWGCNGYGRMGLGTGLQNDVLLPKVVPSFSGPNPATTAKAITTGPTNTVVIDQQNMYWMAGKWKNTGDGSAGQPYSSFRYFQEMMGCNVIAASCGGVTHWALVKEEDGSIMTIAFGQGASNGELGLGPDEPKSATKPTQNKLLAGIQILQVAAGQNTTFFIAKPSEKLSDLPRHPFEMEAPELCVVCNQDTGDDPNLLVCERCDNPYHIGCLDPPLDAVPDGEWFCPDCEEEPGAPIVVGAGKKPKKSASGHKRKASGSFSAPKRRK
ncbi:RCC1/BLIP-II protein [Phanerochaete sordida]|uniref:RCC1/BLIP-II protein n=1 Tax=Phanerochaete sordida TaxID=48140 RepID=A0A9P3GEB9_9APHY|nr:RCC1/BLIP-II protein [Phanerochaete sordida]